MNNNWYKKAPFLFLILFLSILALPRYARSFWYNEINSISQYLPPDKTAELNNYLLENVLPELSNNLYLNDNLHGDNGTTIYRPGKAYDGYTLLSAVRGKLCNNPALFAPEDIYFRFVAKKATCNSILIDMNGNVVKEWPLIAFPVEMLPGGNVLGAVINRFDVIAGMPLVKEMDYCGNSVWSWQGQGTPLYIPPPAGLGGGARFHHDISRSTAAVYHAPSVDPSDMLGAPKRTLVLSNHDGPLPGLSFLGISVPWSDFPLQDDALFEVNHGDGTVWSWYPAEHMEELGFDDAAKWGIKTVRSMGIGGPPADQFGPTDWLHLNTANYLGPNKWYAQDERFHPSNILIDSRTANFLAIIARYANPGKWNSGDVIWRVGPDYSDGNKENRIEQIIGPHLAHMIPPGLPGEGNILVFDNGGSAGYGLLLSGLPKEFSTYPNTYRDYSRIVEFNPITYEKVWEYKLEVERTIPVDKQVQLQRKFYSRLISNAQRLPNGNTLITEGQSGRVFEVTTKGDIAWEFINKYFDGSFTVGPATFLPPNAVYRAYRVPKSWAKTCP